MEEKVNIAFDIGTRNFSYCVCVCNTLNVREWKNIDISDKDIIVMTKNLKKVLDDLTTKFTISNVFVERQMKSKMLMIEALVFGYFIFKNINTERINPVYKLKNCPDFFEEICNIKSSYRRNKKRAVLWVSQIIKENNEIDEKFKQQFEKSKKKDDMSDTILYLYQKTIS